MSDAPPISILVPTRQGWPVARRCVAALDEQVAAAGGEIVVVDGSGGLGPEAGEVGPHLRWVAHERASVFQLRRDGYPHCRGEVVTVTEDHCRPRPDFVARVLAALEAHPEAIAVSGSVENGTPERAIDQAAYLITQGAFVAPVVSGPSERLSGTSLSLRRAAVERLDERAGMGTIELFDVPALRREGEVLWLDDTIRVEHDQRFGFRRTSAIEFHNGRTVAAFRRVRMGGGDWLRILGAPILPLYRAVRSVRIVRGRVSGGEIGRCLPAMVWLQYCTGLGEFVGYLAGPGDSPFQLN